MPDLPATMSALSSEYNILSAVCTNDIYRDLVKKIKKNQRTKIVMDRSFFYFDYCHAVYINWVSSE